MRYNISEGGMGVPGFNEREGKHIGNSGYNRFKHIGVFGTLLVLYAF